MIGVRKTVLTYSLTPLYKNLAGWFNGRYAGKKIRKAVEKDKPDRGIFWLDVKLDESVAYVDPSWIKGFYSAFDKTERQWISLLSSKEAISNILDYYQGMNYPYLYKGIDRFIKVEKVSLTSEE